MSFYAWLSVILIIYLFSRIVSNSVKNQRPVDVRLKEALENYARIYSEKIGQKEFWLEHPETGLPIYIKIK